MEGLLYGLPGQCTGVPGAKRVPFISSLNLQKGVVHIVGGGIKVPPFLLIQEVL
ncbi:hypothetical protein MTBMA_c17330 [Methanothermobacter marburgensis str. Marburg]|uniref:Uncharacterized protein n=1 Tax=Methanothermobacter marburgensis (strain ATCC BAA-927 / DSM 2133 / JCM 14651 / NBRC 100331 / OCM 82 / Marburg) TaxID=79929 RepID=D9PYK3_METTM|nr:hypothetical protein MTBMA_c17330 [Methanothermobacter marburgensis str. Marburg]